MTGIARSTCRADSAKPQAMGTIHKFKRPSNKQQFRGYKPGLPGGPGAGKPLRRQLRGWQRSVIAWTVLILLAGGIWGISAIAGNA